MVETININVSEEMIEDTLVSAFEGGSGYWCCFLRFRNRKQPRKEPYLPSYITTPLSEDGVLVLSDEEEGVILELNRKKILKGIKIMAEKYPKHFGDMISNNGDATTGDVFLQCALFGEIKYG